MFWLSIFSSTYKITDAKSAHPQFFPSHSALIPQLWTSCLGKSSSCEDRVGGLSCSSLSLLAKSLCIPDAPSICPYLPSRSSFSKLVPCSECAPRLSTTASSSFLCWAQTHYTLENHRHGVSWTWNNTFVVSFPILRLFYNLHLFIPLTEVNEKLNLKTWSTSDLLQGMQPFPLREIRARSHLHQSPNTKASRTLCCDCHPAYVSLVKEDQRREMEKKGEAIRHPSIHLACTKEHRVNPIPDDSRRRRRTHWTN